MGGSVATQGIGQHPTQALGTAIKVQLPAGTQMKSVSSPLHNGIGVDMNGNVWFWGVNDGGQRGDGTDGGATTYVPVQITTDSSGNPFNNVAQVSCWYNEVLSSTGESSTGALVCKNDGTVWVWGNTIGGMRGNGQYGQINYKPVQVNIPGNPHIVKVLAGEICMALDDNGNVYTWGGNGRNVLLGTNATNYMVPAKVNLPKPAKDIAGADMFVYALATDGTLYGWGIYGAYLGIGTGPYLQANTFQALPVNLTSDLNLPKPISQIMCNSVSTHVILTDSTLWGWGDNTEGNIGNGTMANWASYSTPYAWDWGAAEILQNKPVQIAPLVHNFTAMFAGSSACFYMYAETATGQLYSWGRGKSEVLSDGTMGGAPDLESVYPDGWNQPTITAVNPFTLTKIYPSTCPICKTNPGANACSAYTIPTDQPPVAMPGAAQTISLPATTGVLDGSGSHDPDGVVLYYKWAQVSGPSANTLLDPTYAQTRLSGLVAGTYVYSLTVTDNGWATNTATVTVTVKATGNVAPTVTAGNGPTITLPTSSTTLTGTATGNNGATIKGVSWKQASGPATATIASPASLSTAVSGLTVAGTYVFTLTATDNNNLTATANVPVVVNAAVVTVAPTVSAGKGQAITLPTSSTTLTGTAAGNSGATIQTITWKETSGPATATIASPSSVSTVVSGLTVAGNYVFTLYATDNNGKSANGSMTVAVNPNPNGSKTTAPVTEAPPTVSAGKGQAITLPASSTTLTGTAAGNDGATITGLTWKQSAGPITATIASPASLSTAVTGMTTAGNYVFTLTATDNNGETANGSITITVNPGVEAAPSVSAGGDPTIQLPTNSITLSGTASGNGGATITGVFWELVSGPGFVKFSNEYALTTTVSGLVVGTYVFGLQATDNHGKTSTSTVDVIVKAAAPAAHIDSMVTNANASIFGDSVDSRPLLLFPNPVHDLLNVRLNSAGTGKVSIVIYNEMGNRVQTIQVEKDQWMIQTSIDVSKLAQGVYTLQVLSGNSINSSRFIKL
ncbi:MAG TPA: T9SS type A sorting domain-containing protein [Puia sp.]|nr:T9SS type A sorting domain-containing protein [Puia sp.]